MHPLTAHFARQFRSLSLPEREEVAQQLADFLRGYSRVQEDEWRRLLWVDGSGVLSPTSMATLGELLNEVDTPAGRKARGS